MNKRLGYLVLIGLFVGLTGCSSGRDDSGDGPPVAKKSVCDGTHLSLCKTEATCITAKGNWYDDSCNSDPSSSWNQMEWDKGQWK